MYLFLALLLLSHDGSDILRSVVRLSSDDKLHIVISAGVIDHIKDGNKRVLLSITEGSAVDEVVAPDVKTPKPLQLAVRTVHEDLEDGKVGGLGKE
jgi:hypothetical protein